MSKITSRARVQVTLEVVVPDTWGSDCPMDQIWKQGRDSALGLIERGIPRSLMQIVGTPKVTAMLVEEER